MNVQLFSVYEWLKEIMVLSKMKLDPEMGDLVIDACNVNVEDQDRTEFETGIRVDKKGFRILLTGNMSYDWNPDAEAVSRNRKLTADRNMKGLGRVVEHWTSKYQNEYSVTLRFRVSREQAREIHRLRQPQ